ncbi:hypothetical protein [Nocardia sp. alder85J]|uniref:DUF7689 domain-containing protein n=1 Tax=Nocardia sp. alder85J TaxID=2862949 RepID=UPI001CD66841|nr:hypothetical protein [Nocardia sp. alder85J]MCX4097592.1 hypothetical protein [Nocardia sp. alder85J]
MFGSASRKVADVAHSLSETLSNASRTLAGRWRRFGDTVTENTDILRRRETTITTGDGQSPPVSGDAGHVFAPGNRPISDDVADRIAETGWDTDPITLRTHSTDAGTVVSPRSWEEWTAGAPPPFHSGLFRSRDGLTELFRMNIDNGVRLDRLEPRTPINPHFNCHGYTFSRNGGAGWLTGRRVDGILSDNGFRRISDPITARPGDVVVYRNDDATITHSGVVAEVTSGEVQVDSKQGPLAVVRHRLREVTGMYGSNVEVYRTDRPGGRFLTPVENTAKQSSSWPTAESTHDS